MNRFKEAMLYSLFQELRQVSCWCLVQTPMLQQQSLRRSPKRWNGQIEINHLRIRIVRQSLEKMAYHYCMLSEKIMLWIHLQVKASSLVIYIMNACDCVYGRGYDNSSVRGSHPRTEATGPWMTFCPYRVRHFFIV